MTGDCSVLLVKLMQSKKALIKGCLHQGDMVMNGQFWITGPKFSMTLGGASQHHVFLAFVNYHQIVQSTFLVCGENKRGS